MAHDPSGTASSSSWWASLVSGDKTSNASSSNGSSGGILPVTPPSSTCPATDTSCASAEPVASLEEAAKYAQTPQFSDQPIPLATHRQVSSIPRVGATNDQADEATKCPASSSTTATIPHHQYGSSDKSNWVYPSEQQLYNAMRKKGYDNVPAQSIPIVLQIHNTVNEQTWQQIQDYYLPTTVRRQSTMTINGDNEDDQDLTLVRFQGRPRDLTPKAWFYTNVLGYPPPFDRHDWYVRTKQNPNNEQRFVIDYYMTDGPQNVPRTIIDARPALDDPYSAYLRVRQTLQDIFPGITKWYYSTSTRK